MNCEDFERLWQARLDARGTTGAKIERELDAHATTCVACRTVAAKYALLGQAIGSLRPTAPPEGFAERCCAAVTRGPARLSALAFWQRSPWVVRLAVAASVLAALGVGLYSVGRRPREPVVKAPQPLLTDALADATSATWDLALEASGPAARVGRGVLGTAVETAPADGAAGFLGSSPSDAASGVLEAFGERVNAGVQPLSGSAKHAFGFLFSPALDGARDNPRPS